MNEMDQIRERLNEITRRLQEIDAEHRGVALSPEAQTEYDGLRKEYIEQQDLLSELTLRKEQLDEIAERGEDPNEAPERRERREAEFQTARPGAVRGEDIWDLSNMRSSVTNPGEFAPQLRDRAMRAIERAVFPHPSADKEDSQGHLERLIEQLDGQMGEFSRHVLVTGSPLYRKAFVRALGKQMLSADEQRAMNLTGETGGFLLPFTLDPTVIPVTDGAVNPIRGLADVVQTTTNLWKGVTSEGMEAKYREAEAEETTDDSPKFKQPEITCHAADAFAEWSYEFGQDYGSIAPQLSVMVQRAKDILEAAKLLEGSGEKEPFGVLTGAEEVVETATEKVFAPATDLRALEEALGDFYTSKAVWLAHRGIYNAVAKAEAEGAGPLWTTLNSLQVGIGNTTDGRVPRPLLEYPAYRSSKMQTKVEQGKYIVLFGDFSYYKVADRIGMLAKPIDSVPGKEGKPTGQEGLYFWWRNGAKVMHKKAFRKLKVR